MHVHLGFFFLSLSVFLCVYVDTHLTEEEVTEQRDKMVMGQEQDTRICDLDLPPGS